MSRTPFREERLGRSIGDGEPNRAREASVGFLCYGCCFPSRGASFRGLGTALCPRAWVGTLYAHVWVRQYAL